MLPVFIFPRAIVLECGAHRTTLGAFRRSGARLCLEQFATVALPDPVDRAAGWLAQTQAALVTLRGKVSRDDPVVLVLPPHLVLTKMIRTPRVDAAKRSKVIRFAAEQNIPYALTDVVWDSAEAGDRDLDREELLAAAKLDAIEALCEAARASGFSPAAILPAALTTLAGFRLARLQGEEPILVLNLGACSSTLLQVAGRRFVARSLTFGPRSAVPEAGPDLPTDGSETGATGSKGLANALAAGASESLVLRLSQEVTRSVLYFRRECGMAQPVRLVLFGGGALADGLSEALSGKLKLPVERLGILGSIEMAGEASPEQVGAGLDALVDIVGAAAIQLLPGHSRLTLLPPRWQAEATACRRRPWFAAAAVVALFVLLPPLFHFERIAASAQRGAKAIERELAPLRKREARDRREQHDLAELRRQIAGLQALVDRRTAWIRLFTDLQERLAEAEDVWLDRLQVRTAAGAPLKLLVAGRMLDRANPLAKVSPGTADRVKTLLASLAGSPFVASVEGEWFESDQPGILKFGFVLVTNSHQPL